MICTSITLQTSIRVSPDFVLCRHSSSPFGFYLYCSDAMLMPVNLFTPLSLMTKTRTTDKLPNPCFKTGAINSLTLDKFRRFALSVLEVFSSFVHTTCTLSVSSRYLAFDGAYHRLKAPFSRYPTRSNAPYLLSSYETKTLNRVPIEAT